MTNPQPGGQPPPSGQLIRRPPTGGIVRGTGFAKPAEPVELTIAKVRLIQSVVPALLLAGGMVGAGYFLQQLLTASPNAQMVAAQREANIAHNEAIKEVARSSGCRSLICINLGKAQEPSVVIEQPTPQPPSSGYYQPPPYQSQGLQPIQSVQIADEYNPQKPVYWSSRFHDQGWTESQIQVCERDVWISPECLALSQALHR